MKTLRRLFFSIAAPLRRLYWFVFRPKTRGSKVIVECDGSLLMIRNTYGKRRWTFPGGGVERKESPEEGAKRELMEEVGIAVPSLSPIGEILNAREWKKDTVYCFAVKVESREVAADPGEIQAYAWFDIGALPADMSETAHEAVGLWKRGNFSNCGHGET